VTGDASDPGSSEDPDAVGSVAGSSTGDSSAVDSSAVESPAVEVPAGESRSAESPPGASVQRKRARSRFELPILIVVAVALAVLVKSFLVQPFYIPSESMENTLHGCKTCRGDRILVFKPVYRVRSPHPGDIVVFKGPSLWADEGGTVLSSNPIVHAAQVLGQVVGVVAPSQNDLVKRVIATGGQTVKCCDAAGNVEVATDGVHFRSLNEPYIFENNDMTFGPVLVPRGRLWVMGDHRGDSADSRYHCQPDSQDAGSDAERAQCDPVSSTVPVGNVIGKAVVIAWPPSRWRTLGTPATFAAAGLTGPIATITQPSGIVLAATAFVGFSRRRPKYRFPRLWRRFRGPR
jgi:signal peptidase I